MISLYDRHHELRISIPYLWNQYWFCIVLRKDEVAMMHFIDAGLLVISLLVLGYLLYALINPEKF